MRLEYPIDFPSTAARDAFLAQHFPTRNATQLPGWFELPNRAGHVGVRCERVTFYGQAAVRARDLWRTQQ